MMRRRQLFSALTAAPAALAAAPSVAKAPPSTALQVVYIPTPLRPEVQAVISQTNEWRWSMWKMLPDLFYRGEITRDAAMALLREKVAP